MAWRLGDGGMGVLLWHEGSVTVVLECYVMEVWQRWKQSVVMAWKLGDGENISNWKRMDEY